MSHHPSYTLAALCVVGGIAGYARTRSLPSLVAGVGVGSMYALAGYRIQTGKEYGYELAAAASTILVLASAPRARKGPVPLALTVAGLTGGGYYGNQVYKFRYAGA